MLPSPVIYGIQFTTAILFGCGSFIAAAQVKRYPSFQWLQRPLWGFASLFVGEFGATCLQLAVPTLNLYVVNALWLTLSALVCGVLFWVARTTAEAAVLLILIGAEAVVLSLNIPALVSPPPMLDLIAAWSLLGIVLPLPYCWVQIHLIHPQIQQQTTAHLHRNAILITCCSVGCILLCLTEIPIDASLLTMFPHALPWMSAAVGAAVLWKILGDRFAIIIKRS